MKRGVADATPPYVTAEVSGGRFLAFLLHVDQARAA